MSTGRVRGVRTVRALGAVTEPYVAHAHRVSDSERVEHRDIESGEHCESERVEHWRAL